MPRTYPCPPAFHQPVRTGPLSLPAAPARSRSLSRSRHRHSCMRPSRACFGIQLSRRIGMPALEVLSNHEPHWLTYTILAHSHRAQDARCQISLDINPLSMQDNPAGLHHKAVRAHHLTQTSSTISQTSTTPLAIVASAMHQQNVELGLELC